MATSLNLIRYNGVMRLVKTEGLLSAGRIVLVQQPDDDYDDPGERYLMLKVVDRVDAMVEIQHSLFEGVAIVDLEEVEQA